MNDTDSLMNKGRLTTAAILGLAAVAMVWASKSMFWPAVLLGTIVGYFNLEILYRRVGRADPNDFKATLRLMRTGSGIRFSAAVLGALVVVRLKFSITGYIIALVIPQIMVTLIWMLQNSRKRKG